MFCSVYASSRPAVLLAVAWHGVLSSQFTRLSRARAVFVAAVRLDRPRLGEERCEPYLFVTFPVLLLSSIMFLMLRFTVIPQKRVTAKQLVQGTTL